jgi:hypothetical protein
VLTLTSGGGAPAICDHPALHAAPSVLSVMAELAFFMAEITHSLLNFAPAKQNYIA